MMLTPRGSTCRFISTHMMKPQIVGLVTTKYLARLTKVVLAFLSCTLYPVTPSESFVTPWRSCSTVPLTTLISSHSEGVDPRLISGNSTGPSSPDDRRSEDYFDPSSAFPSPCENVGDIDPAEEDEEEPFLSPRPFLTLEYVLVYCVFNISQKCLHIE